MFGFKRKHQPAAAVQDDKKEKLEAWIKFMEDTCHNNLREVLNFTHPDWEPAINGGDFKTLVTMYAAACAASEQHADHMFSEWLKGARRLGMDVDAITTEFCFAVNRRFSHLAQIRCYYDYQLKLTLVPADERARLLPTLARILSPEMCDAFFPTPAEPQKGALADTDKPSDEASGWSEADDVAHPDSSLREKVGILFDRGVNPLRAIKALLHDKDGNLITDGKQNANLWLGINDLLDRDEIGTTLRNQLVGVRDVMSKCLEDTGPEAKAFVTNYRANTKRINEMKFLQSYRPKLIDAAGNMQLEAFQNMLAEIEYERANNPGSLAQDISDEALARLYRLRDNWDDPASLNEPDLPNASMASRRVYLH